jgi:transposase-like protein
MAGKDSRMKKRHSVEQIVGKLRQADVALGKGLKVPEVCRQLGISEQTYYRWRQKYGGMAPEVARQLKALEKENGRLKRVVADQALDIQILKEAARPNW